MIKKGLKGFVVTLGF